MDWDAAYTIGQDPVDADHRRLFDLYNQFGAAIDAGETRQSVNRFLGALADYSEYHFRREEGLMRASGYPDFLKHKAMHDGFAAFIRKQSTACDHDREEVEFLRNYVEMWLCGHILVMDKWFGEWLDARSAKSGPDQTGPGQNGFGKNGVAEPIS